MQQYRTELRECLKYYTLGQALVLANGVIFRKYIVEPLTMKD